MSKNSYLMQFCEINISQVMIFRLYIVCNKHEMIKIDCKLEKNRKYYTKCLNNFAADYNIFVLNFTFKGKNRAVKD